MGCPVITPFTLTNYKECLYTLVICTSCAMITCTISLSGEKMSESVIREEEKKPPHHHHMKRYWKIAVLANIKDESQLKPEGVPPDAFADFDHIETIDSLRA